MAKVKLVGIREYARMRQCAPSAVVKAIDEQRITVVLDEKGRRMIDPDVADIQWARNTRARADSIRSSAADVATAAASVAASRVVPGAGLGDQSDLASATQPPPAADSYNSYRAQTEAENLRRQRRENDLAEGLLVERRKVDRAFFDLFRSLRDAAFSVPEKCAPRCIGLTDVRDVEQAIRDDLRKAFAGWEADMDRRLPRPEGASPAPAVQDGEKAA